MAKRNANGRSSIYRDRYGNWHGRVTVGLRDDGTPDRRHVRGKTQSEVTEKVRKLEKLRDEKRVPKTGQRWTVKSWLEHWLSTVACPPNVSENTHSGYRVAVKVHLIPGLGAHKLDKLEAEHVEKLMTKMIESGKKPATAHQAFRTLKTALNVAVRRKCLARNPVLDAKAPSLDEEEIEVYTVEDVKKLLKLVEDRRNGARWVIALALGLRQGEALGLKWEDVDLKKGVLHVRRARLRPKYGHGCEGGCGRKPGYCPDKVNVRPETGRVKSRAGKRSIGLPDPLIELLKEHQRRQEMEKEEARQLWAEKGYVFAKPNGEPLSPNTDFHEWKDLLVAAGLREARLHDARHTAATVLLILGVPTPTVMSIMGWSSAAMARRYQHIVDEIRREVADQVSGLLWESPKKPEKSKKKGKKGKKKH